MQVKFLKPRNWGGTEYKAGAIGDLPDVLAGQWIGAGIVEAVLPEPVAAAEPEPVAKKAKP